MKWFYNLKTVMKLTIAFVITAIIMGFIGFLGLSNLGSMNKSIVDMYEINLVPISKLGDVEILYQRINVELRDMNTMARTAAENNAYKDKILGFAKEIETSIDTYSQSFLTREEEDQLQQFAPLWEEYRIMLNEALDKNSANLGSEQFTEFLLTGGMDETGDKLEAILEKLIELNTQLAEHARGDSDELYTSSRYITVAIIIAALILSIGFGYLISQIIARPLNRVVRLVGKVADGDLSEISDINSKDEIGVLAASVNDMVFKLRETVGEILASAESVSAASQQISASTEEIASGSMSQANAAQTMNELFRELSLAINSVARSAEQASELSNKTMSIAQDGGKVVRVSIDGMTRVNEQMSRLEEDSNKIGEIIEVIDDIAEQTNLLALNAAIEAARAGDQGRGFAVVADEVRKLAERSSEATKQITNIIKGMQDNTGQSVKAVAEGVSASQRTGEAFEHIISMVNETAYKVTEIAAASEEQAAQSSEVMSSIESISAATEEAAASSEETASTAQSLAQLAEELNNSVSIFKIR
ncbi:methyl-accepting chemotaxis protein [Paenibacillus oenotherae]|uniref:Methyl-accepting chemotaxis protein n=1 Tax=Paenibacillus oenotherae TaxID=1435645 RepID=A0ABS7D2Y8_9BACL|nr:methyl-accepting chemotaxis protein [Paenibacillus oenotherae]MBW7474292.1 methyl-accepting chemotaxis protein [Paenibacillus oenotherae]